MLQKDASRCKGQGAAAASATAANAAANDGSAVADGHCSTQRDASSLAVCLLTCNELEMQCQWSMEKGS